MSEVTPRHARRVVVCAGGFWACWGAAVLTAPNPATALFCVAGVALGFGLYVTSGDMVADTTGMSGARLMFSFSRERSMRRARRRSVLVLLSPRWWRRVLIATGWPAVPVGVILLALLATDLVLAFTALPGLGSRSTS